MFRENVKPTLIGQFHAFFDHPTNWNICYIISIFQTLLQQICNMFLLLIPYLVCEYAVWWQIHQYEIGYACANGINQQCDMIRMQNSLMPVKSGMRCDAMRFDSMRMDANAMRKTYDLNSIWMRYEYDLDSIRIRFRFDTNTIRMR
jgi:hypothetical protein